MSIVAASMVAADIGRRATGWAFSIFTVASVLWIGFGAVDKNWGLVVQNVALTAINLLGVFKYLILKKTA